MQVSTAWEKICNIYGIIANDLQYLWHYYWQKKQEWDTQTSERNLKNPEKKYIFSLSFQTG